MSTPTPRARGLRRNASDAENRLWYVLRNRQIASAKFVRQFPMGPYFADFACRSAKLVIELDGGQHADSVTDAARTAYLKLRGYSVLRFWNTDVMSNRDAVVSVIASVLSGGEVPEGIRFERGVLSPGSRRVPTSPGWSEEEEPD